MGTWLTGDSLSRIHMEPNLLNLNLNLIVISFKRKEKYSVLKINRFQAKTNILQIEPELDWCFINFLILKAFPWQFLHGTGGQSLYWLPVHRWQYPWWVGQLIQFQSANLASLLGNLKNIYTVQFDFWVCRQMGYLNSLCHRPVFIYSYASYKSDAKRNNRWTA